MKQASALLATEKGSAFVLAGGTDLLVRMRTGFIEPDLVVDTTDLIDLKADSPAYTPGPLLRFTGSEDRFDLVSHGEPEFESWRWVDYWTPVREVIYFKRAVYARALDELARTAFPQDPPALPEWSEQEKNLRNLARRRAASTDGTNS